MRFKAKKEELVFFLTDTNLFVLGFEKSFEIKRDFKIEELISYPEAFKKEFASKEVKVLVIPDYWIVTKFYPIATKKASVIESFLKRKLPVDFPDSSDCKDFFEYVFYRQAEQEGIQVYVIQEELFYVLYRNLFSSFSIEKITTAAFVWKAKLGKKIKDINKGLKIFVHLYEDKAYLCFFLESHFLFSRLISAEENYINQVSYELMQSFRLVSQKTKKEVEKLYLIPKQDSDAQKLSETLDVEVVDISTHINLSLPSAEVVKKIGSFAFLDRSDLSDSSRFFYLTYRPLREQKEWTFFQNIGIGAGIFVLLLMLLEAVCINRMLPKFKNTTDVSTPVIQQYISVIEDIIRYKERPDFSLVIMKLLNCSSEEVYFQHIGIEPGPPYRVELTGYVSAFSVEKFQEIFSDFLSKIRKSFRYAQIPALTDVDIKREGQQDFKFRFSFELNEE